METPATALERIKGWLAVPANVTRGWLLLSVLIGFVFVGCALYAAVQTVRIDNRVTQAQVAETVAAQITLCVANNDRRAEAKLVALADVQADREAVVSDRASWLSIDSLFPDGIPEPARTTIFGGLDNRLSDIDNRITQIDKTYSPTDCSQIVTAAAAASTPP